MKLLFFAFSALAVAADTYPPPRFADPERATKLEAAMPAVDAIFQRFAADRKITGMVWGMVIDNKLAHVSATGLRDRATNSPVTQDSVFRIASMTKSFTALAVLKLRDEGKLSLEDPVSRWIPEFARMEMPTRDTPRLTVRHLMSHSAGFPEDNPWGDQQLAATDAQLDAWLRKGIPFSTVPGTRYEYSNYAFGLLGRVVTKASKMPYEKYMREQILSKLGMNASTFAFADVPAAGRAKGYRLQPDGSYSEEAPLPHGVFGSMGGLLTTATDLGKYLAFHLSAWPPRDDAESGPVRRSSVREMAHLWTPGNFTVTRSGGVLKASETGYGFGLRVTTDCRFEHIVAHGGGLPGFGSYMAWLPEYGVAMFAMTNLTYAGPAAPIGDSWDVLLKTGGLRKRELPASPMLTQMREPIIGLWKHWDEASARQIGAMNLLLDYPSDQRAAGIQKLKDEVGECTVFGPVQAENWLRGQFNVMCAKGTVGVFYTLAPTQPPAVQHLEFRKIAPDFRMGAPTGAPAGVACSDN